MDEVCLNFPPPKRSRNVNSNCGKEGCLVKGSIGQWL